MSEDLALGIETLRIALRSESISYGELADLQGMVERHEISPDDLELLEAGGLPEADLADYAGRYAEAHPTRPDVTLPEARYLELVRAEIERDELRRRAEDRGWSA